MRYLYREISAVRSSSTTAPKFQSVHDLSHPCRNATAKLVVERLVWPRMQKDCRTWAHACQSCQHSKVSRHTVTPLDEFTPPAARFLHVHVDLAGPLPTSAGYTYSFTAVDRFTLWQKSSPTRTSQPTP
jgi:hypothetical protein